MQHVGDYIKIILLIYGSLEPGADLQEVGEGAIDPSPRKVGRKRSTAISTILDYCSLQKSHPECTKMRHFPLRSQKKFLGKGHSPLPDFSPRGRETAPIPHSLGTFGHIYPHAFSAWLSPPTPPAWHPRSATAWNTLSVKQRNNWRKTGKPGSQPTEMDCVNCLWFYTKQGMIGLCHLLMEVRWEHIDGK